MVPSTLNTFLDQIPDPTPFLIVSGIFLIVYFLVWWRLTRPTAEQIPIVHHRPLIGRALTFGRTVFVGIGTFGAHLVTRVSVTFSVQGNCQDQIAGIGLIELNQQRRAEVNNKGQLSGYRVWWAHAPLLKDGLSGMPIVDVNRPENRVKWVRDLRLAITNFSAMLRRPAHLVSFDVLRFFIPSAHEPTICLIWISPGGHLLLGIEAAKHLKAQFPHADFYALTILAETTEQRAELAEALRIHDQDPIFRGWFVADNRLGKDRNDRLTATFLSSIWQAYRVAPQTQDPYNLLRSLCKLSKLNPNDGVVLVLSGWEHPDLATYSTPLPPHDFLIHRDDAVNAVLNGILAVEDSKYKVVNLPTPLPNSQRYIVVDIALRQPYLSQLEEEIKERLSEIGFFRDDPNRQLIFSSLGQQLTRSSRYIPVTVMLIQAATTGVPGLEQLALADQEATSNPTLTPLQLDGTSAAASREEAIR